MPSTVPQSPIAIVGISVEIPGGSDATNNLDHKSFFEFLLASGEAYEDMPTDRFNIDAWKGTGIGKIHVNKGAFLKEIDVFDNVEFGISSKDAYYMAPAARKLVEHSFLALLDSGIDCRSKRVGVFTSATSIEMTNVSEPDEIDVRGSFAGYPSMVANRISHHLDLLGPSVPVDTACSSTLTAMHLAVQAVTCGDCEAAVVGGCQLNHRFIDWFTYSQGSILAKDGKCKPFDSNADGFSRAEACAVVVIKPLEDAIRDQDRIYATILATAINSTGGAAAPGAPVAESQRDAMVQAFARANRDPREVDYVELHATGTAKGDPTEANWVGERFHREDELLIGSVKANIGHTEIVAFLASLSKVISIFEHKVIPPQINIKKLNPGIKWDDYRLKVPLDVTPLPARKQTKSLVAISSSGIGGSNGHVVLESPPEGEKDRKISSATSDGPLLLALGTLSSRTITATADAIREKLSEYKSELRGLSTVLGRRSRQGTWRSYGIVGPKSTLLAEFTAPVHTPRTPNPMVFVFSGQGPQHIDMGRELFQKFPAFRGSVLEMDAVFERVTGRSIIRDYGLFDKPTAPSLPEIWPIALVLPSIAVFQMALFDLMTSLGVKPDIVVGHSAGETAVLYTSGAAPKSMAVELAIIRGRSFTPVEELGGTMAALSCTPEELDELLADHRKANPQVLVELACYNSPSAVAIAGNEADVDVVVAAASVRGVFARKIRTKVPFHSSMMESSEEKYSAALVDLFNRYPGVHIPKTATFSTCTGKLFEETFDAQYYWSNTRSPVQFTQTIQAIGAAYPNATYVEFSPHPVLVSYVTSMTSETSTVLHSVQRPRRGAPSTEEIDILHVLGKMTSAGYNGVDFTSLNGRTCSEFSLPLPAYPFARKKYPLYPDTPGVEKQMEVFRGPLNHPYLRMNKDTHPLLAEHVIRGQPIMAAAAFLEMALEFGASTLINVNFRSILSLSSEKPIKVNINLDGAYWAVKSTPLNSRRGGTSVTQNDRLHADGYLSFEVPKSVPPLDIEAIRNRCEGHIEGGFYPALSYFSAYGPRFQRVTNIYFNTNEALASIKGLDRVLINDGKYFLHPAVLDACIHVFAYKPFQGDYNPNVYYLPAHVDAFIVHQKLKQHYFPSHIYAHVQLKKWKPNGIIYDVCLVEDSGKCLCTIIGLEVAKHRLNPVTEPSRPLEVIMQPVLHPPRSEPTVSCSQPDRSCFFFTLDKITTQSNICSVGATERPVNVVQLYPKLHDDAWGPYLDSVGDKSMQPPKGFQFNRTIKCILEGFRCCLEAFRMSSTRVLQIFISSNAKTDHFRLGMEKVLQEFPSIYTEIFIDIGNGHAWETIHPASGIVHNVKLDFENPKQITEDRLFDLALFFDVAGGQVTPEIIAEAAETVLLPGGTLILAERNLDAWNDLSLGTVCRDAVFDRLQASEAFDLVSYKTALKKFSLLRTHKFEDADPFHFCIEAQKATWSKEARLYKPLFNEEDSFAYHYSSGTELDLQWEFSGLNTEQNIDVWILATEDSGTAKGMVRALRKEYVSWTIRLVIFPASFDEEAREDFLLKLPLELRHEQEIVVSGEQSNILLVPRVVPAQPLEQRRTEPSQPETPPAHSILIKRISVSKQGLFSGVLASVVDENATNLERNQLVIGLVDGAVDEFMVVDAAAFIPVPAFFAKHERIAPVLAPGFVSTILAFGLSNFSRPHRLKASRMLLTHADTAMGLSISKLSRRNSIYVKQINQGASLYDISQLQSEGYDVVFSGYTNRSYVQILSLLLKPDCGRLFLWNDEHNGLPGVLRRDPYSVGDALSFAFNSIAEADLEATTFPQYILSQAENPAKDILRKQAVAQSVYDPNKTYIILGGIGSLGAHLALFLYERGARYVTVTSRSGRKSLDTNANGIVKRMFEYLDQREDLELSLSAVDATDDAGMSSMLNEIGHSNIGGCFLLTAVLSDGIFSQLEEKDFISVYAAKLGPIATLKRLISLDSLDFIVAFTSPSGIFGIGGQTNYSAANTALEEEIMLHNNAFSFVCPPVLDSTLMVAGASEVNKSRLGAVIPWSLTSEDMVAWLDDSMHRHQHGQRVIRYIPDLDWEAMDRVNGMPRIGKHLLVGKKEPTDPDSVTGEVREIARIVKDVLDIPECDFSPEVPLTAYGIDSLSATRLAFLLRPFVKVTQIQILGDISVSDLTAAAQSDATEAVQLVKVHQNSNSKTRIDIMKDMLAKYSLDAIPPPRVKVQRCAVPLPEVVLVTGTTGNLGCNLLAQLVQNDEVKHVYAFNRIPNNGETSQARHEGAFLRHGLRLLLLASPKLVFLEGDLTKDAFGLSDATFRTLLSTVTHIIHNAWNTDVNLPLDAHEDSIYSTRRLLDFVLESSCLSNPSISFISTIGIYQNTNHTVIGAFPEESVLDPSLSSGQNGYIESKWVAERLLQRAADVRGLSINILRVGLLTGGLSGYWDPSQWFPRIVESASYLGCLPNGTDTVSWIPTNLAASAIIDMRCTEDRVLHIIHPKPTKWNTVMKSLSSILNVPLVPYMEWYSRLKSCVNDENEDDNIDWNRRAALTHFYRMGLNATKNTESMGLLPIVGFEKGFKASKSLQSNSVCSLSGSDATHWVDYWRKIGFLPPLEPETSKEAQHYRTIQNA